jgi:hypothetical protein
VVPAAACTVTLALAPGGDVHVRPPAPVTVSGPAKVGQLKAIVDGLPVFPPGRCSCPYDDGAALTLTFGTWQAGPALAVATVRLEGCGGVAFTVNGRPQPGLGAAGGGQRVAAQALKAAGLNWKPSSYLSRIYGLSLAAPLSISYDKEIRTKRSG